MNVPSPRLTAEDIRNLPKSKIITQTEDYELIDCLPEDQLEFGDDDWLMAYDGIVVVVGRGATGKTKFIEAVLDIYPATFTYVPVHTTRKLRETERQGVDIVCVDDAEFDARRKNKEYMVSYWVGHGERRKRSALPLEPVKQALRTGKRVITVLPAPVSDWLAYQFGHVFRVCLNPSAEDHRRYQEFRGLSPGDSEGKNIAGFIFEEEYAMPGVIVISNVRWRIHGEIKKRTRRREDGGHDRTLYEMVVKPARLYLSNEYSEVAGRTVATAGG